MLEEPEHAARTSAQYVRMRARYAPQPRANVTSRCDAET
jgi:hypothetical protein